MNTTSKIRPQGFADKSAEKPYAALSTNVQRLIDTTIAIEQTGKDAPPIEDLTAERNRRSTREYLHTQILNSSSDINAIAKARGVNPLDPTASFPEALKAQAGRSL